VNTNDSARAIGAAQAFGLISTEAWPMVAAYLVAEGFEGADTVAMAALPLRSSAWDVEPLIDGILGDIDASAAANDDAAWIVARMLAIVIASDDEVLTRLARFASPTGYVVEPFASASFALEQLDAGVEVGSWYVVQFPNAASEARALPPLGVSPELAAWLVGMRKPSQ